MSCSITFVQSWVSEFNICWVSALMVLPDLNVVDSFNTQMLSISADLPLYDGDTFFSLWEDSHSTLGRFFVSEFVK